MGIALDAGCLILDAGTNVRAASAGAALTELFEAAAAALEAEPLVFDLEALRLFQRLHCSTISSGGSSGILLYGDGLDFGLASGCESTAGSSDRATLSSREDLPFPFGFGGTDLDNDLEALFDAGVLFTGEARTDGGSADLAT